MRLGTCLMRSLQRSAVEPVIVRQNAPEVGEYCSAPIASPWGEITFSTTSTSRGFAPGTTAALRCAFGRWVVGPSFSTCTRGVFRPLLGKCSDGREEALPGVCMPLTPPTNGLITYIQAGRQENFEIGTTALLYCMASHAVTGQATVVCSKDGWQPATGLGTCDPTERQI
nr:Protein F36H2.3, isoform c [Haemonchus contortus]